MKDYKSPKMEMIEYSSKDVLVISDNNGVDNIYNLGNGTKDTTP